MRGTLGRAAWGDSVSAVRADARQRRTSVQQSCDSEGHARDDATPECAQRRRSWSNKATIRAARRSRVKQRGCRVQWGRASALLVVSRGAGLERNAPRHAGRRRLDAWEVDRRYGNGAGWTCCTSASGSSVSQRRSWPRENKTARQEISSGRRHHPTRDSAPPQCSSCDGTVCAATRVWADACLGRHASGRRRCPESARICRSRSRAVGAGRQRPTAVRMRARWCQLCRTAWSSTTNCAVTGAPKLKENGAARSNSSSLNARTLSAAWRLFVRNNSSASAFVTLHAHGRDRHSTRRRPARSHRLPRFRSR